MSTSKPEYWRRKLSAYLHDSPDKVINLVDHEGRARSLAQVEGFQPTEAARKESDFAASAADRLPWPKSKLGSVILCRSEFNVTDKALLHPLGQAAIRFASPFASAEAALTDSQATRPRIADDDPRAAFITAWRFWRNWASSADERFACLPAETRLPDHTIWNHLAVTSALQGCYGGSQKAWLDARESKQPAPPNWICTDTGAVLLRSVDETERRRRRNLNYAGKGYETHEGNALEISARLVAAIVPKPLVVTGWALPNAEDPERDADGGAKSTHLAVPAGAIYYFEADSSEAALALAKALNWHGATDGTAIKNRRSTLLGEKGYGLGVCGTWKHFGNVP